MHLHTYSHWHPAKPKPIPNPSTLWEEMVAEGTSHEEWGPIQRLAYGRRGFLRKSQDFSGRSGGERGQWAGATQSSASSRATRLQQWGPAHSQRCSALPHEVLEHPWAVLVRARRGAWLAEQELTLANLGNQRNATSLNLLSAEGKQRTPSCSRLFVPLISTNITLTCNNKA